MLAILLAASLAAPPVSVTAPNMQAGEEHRYSGDAVEESFANAHRWTRSTHVEVRIFALSSSDYAILTLRQPLENAGIAKVAVEVNGANKEAARLPLVSLVLVRWSEGTLLRLSPTATVPLVLNAKTPASAVDGVPHEGVAVDELGMLPPRTKEGVKPGDTWTRGLAWTAKPPVVLDGADVIEFSGEHVEGRWEKPNAFDKPWRRQDRVWLAPTDGLARVLWRRIERKHGPDLDYSLEMRLDYQPLAPHRGEGLDRVRREIEFAVLFESQFQAIPTDQRPALAAKIERYCEDYPATPFREAVEAVGRRCRTK